MSGTVAEASPKLSSIVSVPLTNNDVSQVTPYYPNFTYIEYTQNHFRCSKYYCTSNMNPMCVRVVYKITGGSREVTKQMNKCELNFHIHCYGGPYIEGFGKPKRKVTDLKAFYDEMYPKKNLTKINTGVRPRFLNFIIGFISIIASIYDMVVAVQEGNYAALFLGFAEVGLTVATGGVAGAAVRVGKAVAKVASKVSKVRKAAGTKIAKINGVVTKISRFTKKIRKWRIVNKRKSRKKPITKYKRASSKMKSRQTKTRKSTKSRTTKSKTTTKSTTTTTTDSSRPDDSSELPSNETSKLDNSSESNSVNNSGDVSYESVYVDVSVEEPYVAGYETEYYDVTEKEYFYVYDYEYVTEKVTTVKTTTPKKSVFFPAL